MQLSSFIGKPVLSPSGENYGYVTGARLTKDRNTLACLVCADAEEEEFYLPRRAVLSSGDAVIANRVRLTAPTGVPSPIGTEVYLHTGEARGTVADVLFGESAEAFLVVVKDGVSESVPVSCAVFGARIILYPDAASKPAARHTAPREKRPKKSGTSPKPAPERETAIARETAIEREAAPAARKNAYDLNRTNLLGRTVQRSVFDRYGTVVAAAGDRVTPAVLAAARRANCLLQLAVNTLTRR